MVDHNWPTRLRKNLYSDFKKYSLLNKRGAFWTLKMYLQFAPKMNDFYEVEASSFNTWKYSKFGHFGRAISWKPL